MTVHVGDCVEVMAGMPEASVDAIVCDPPYHLAFMGRAWDTVTPGQSQHEHERWAREALRVLKPGGALLAFGGTRTYHRLTSGIEDAGFEIRDTLAWMYGSGFPKSLDVGKAIDKAAGATREDRGPGQWAHVKAGGTWTGGVYGDEPSHGEGPRSTAPATSEAQAWEGWGTALKPAHEPIILARKPLAGTVAGNVLAHGTGALNIDGCRIQGDVPSVPKPRFGVRADGVTDFGAGEGRNGEMSSAPSGRWPANVLLDQAAADLLDQQTGTLTSGANPTRRGADGDRTAYGEFKGQEDANPQRGVDKGGASRFFYVAKASSAERNAGLDGFEAQIDRPTTMAGAQKMRACNVCGSRAKPASYLKGDPRPWPSCGHDDWSWQPEQFNHKGARRNVHPTVKPIALMRWLIRLVTPPGGLVLDPFTGSGTTGCAAALEGVRFVGVEKDPEYAAIAQARIAWWAEHPEGVELVERLAAEKQQAEVKDRGQTSIFDFLEDAA